MEASFDFLEEIYSRLSLLFMHVTSQLVEAGWRMWPKSGSGLDTTMSASLDSSNRWMLRFAGRGFSEGRAAAAERPSRLLFFGILLRKETKPHEPVAHGVLFRFTRPLERTDWDWSWYWEAVCQPDDEELDCREEVRGDVVLYRTVPKKEARRWSQMESAEYFATPLSRLESEEDVRSLIVNPLLSLGSGSPRRARGGSGSAP